MTISTKDKEIDSSKELDLYSAISEDEEVIIEEYHLQEPSQQQSQGHTRRLTSPFDEEEKREGLLTFSQVINGVPIAKDVFEMDETGFHQKSNKKNGFFKGLLVAVTGVILIALVGAGYAAYVLLGTAFAGLLGAIRSIWFTIIYMITSVFGKLLSVFGTIIFIIVGMHFFWKLNPELRSQFDLKKSQVENTIRSYVGVSLPKMPELQDIFDFFGGKAKNLGVEMPEFGSISGIFKSWGLSDLDIEKHTPKELSPILGVTQNSEELGKYVELITQDGLGNKVDAAIPLLEDSLMGGNKELSGAAMQSLQMINTPKTKKIIAKYKRLLNNSLKNLNTNEAIKDLQKNFGN